MSGRMFEYYGPMDIASAFSDTTEIGNFLIHLINAVNDLSSNSKNDDFIPHVFYSEMGKSFNIDYNFLIKTLDEYHDNAGIKEDFLLSESPSKSMLKNGSFLIASIFEDYYEIVRIRQRKLDISKLKTQRIVEIKDKFYNILVVKNGDNLKRFSAVHFSASEVKKMIPEKNYNLLNSLSNKSSFEQVAFGIKQYSDLVSKLGCEPKYVTE